MALKVDPMRVLVVHNAYQHRGGEDTVVDNEIAMLQAHGIEVEIARVHNDVIKGAVNKALTFVSVGDNRARARWMHDLVTRSRSDVVHIHNFFPLLSPSIHVAAGAAGAAVIQTLHNYRLLCANAMFMRRGQVCELCLTAGRHNAVVHRCYRGSVVGSAALVAMQTMAERRHVWTRHVDRFIALTDFARSKFVDGGLPVDRIVTKPNFVADPGAGELSAEDAAAANVLYVGRLSPEKGVQTLLDAWRDMPRGQLTIVGDGPDLAGLKRNYGHVATFLGFQSADAVKALMRRASFMVVPSIWYEGFPMTIVEAFSLGLPVVASDIGSLSSIVKHGCNGMKFAPGNPDQLRAAMVAVLGDKVLQRRLAEGARASFNEKYSQTRNIEQLMNIYKDALACAGSGRHP